MKMAVNSLEVELYEKCIPSHKEVKIILVNGFQMLGKIVDYDDVGILMNFKDQSKSEFVYKRQISTICHLETNLSGELPKIFHRIIRKSNQLEDEIYRKAVETMQPVTVFHVNGYRNDAVFLKYDDVGVWAQSWNQGESMYIFRSGISSILFNFFK